MILIGMTWHSTPDLVPKGAPRFYKQDFLVDIRYPFIEKQIGDYVNFIYISGENNKIVPILSGNEVAITGQYHEHIKGFDSFAGMAVAVQYALSNGMDYLYMEHDCLAVGLDKILDWASGKDICYGFGKYGFAPDWAEHSLVYISNSFMPEFLSQMNSTQIVGVPGIVPEIIFHRMFGDAADAWPFGYGRKRPINYKDEIFYAQQLNNAETNNILQEVI